MKRDMRILLVASATLILAACGVFGSMAEIGAQSSATEDAIEKDLGVRPFIGWNVRNGALANVNVTFEQGKVEGMSIGELETHVRAAVSAHFKERPLQLVVSVSIKP